MLKTCTKCGEEKEIEEFYEDKQAKDRHENTCKGCRLERSKEWYAENKDRKVITRRNWISNNRDRWNEIGREWKANNPEKAAISNRKSNSRRRHEFGYIPLNDKFPGSVGHHISKDLVVHIPEELHKSIPHRYDDPISMGQINILALEYLP